MLAEYPETLWSKPATAQWGEVGDLELQFKITVPVKTPGFSYVNFQDYRVFWRVEAGLSACRIFLPPTLTSVLQSSSTRRS